jgi:molecular chaperone DnaJ
MRQTFLGSMVNVSTCPTCQGAGETVSTPCRACHGRGQVRQTRRIMVNVPAGIDHNLRIRLTGEGEPGTNGGPTGNLYVVVGVQPHKYFRRQGDDLLLEMAINPALAALGGEISVPTVTGEERVRIKPGTQPGDRHTLRGQGAPHVQQRKGRGNLHVLFSVATPTNLSRDQQKLLKDLAKSLPPEPVPLERGLVDKVRDFLTEE